MKLCTLRNIIAFVLVLGFVPGCASLGLVTPTTFSERAAYVTATATGARVSALNALASGAITADDAEHVQGLADKMRQGVDIARRLHAAGATASALDRLMLAENVLRELQTYLIAKGVKTP